LNKQPSVITNHLNRIAALLQISDHARRSRLALPAESLPTLSVVVPVYNSRDSLPELVERLAKVLPQVASEYELILVNDGSPDDSWRVIQRLAEEHRFLRGVDLLRNYGQHNALLCGIRAAQYELIATMDDDLQHPPEELHTLLAALANGVDVVYGTPRELPHDAWRNVTSRITKIALQAAMGVETARNVSAFRAFRTQLRDAFHEYRSPFLSLDVLLTWATTRFTAVSVRHEPRRFGRSNYTFRKLLKYAINMITGFSTLPLQLASFTGFFFTLFGIAVLGYVLIRYLLSGSVVPGFAFLASAIAIFSGAQLFALGIVGEYLARMHFRMMERPTYSIRQTSQ
jgi:undecaprenyl-phosphate 4-deoxy-4-formamido-L-arabinose transferase